MKRNILGTNVSLILSLKNLKMTWVAGLGHTEVGRGGEEPKEQRVEQGEVLRVEVELLAHAARPGEERGGDNLQRFKTIARMLFDAFRFAMLENITTEFGTVHSCLTARRD